MFDKLRIWLVSKLLPQRYFCYPFSDVYSIVFLKQSTKIRQDVLKLESLWQDYLEERARLLQQQGRSQVKAPAVLHFPEDTVEVVENSVSTESI